MEQSRRRDVLLNAAGLIVWFTGFAALLTNVWFMRSQSSLWWLWVAGPVLVVTGDVVGSLFGPDSKEDLLLPYRLGSMIAVAAGISVFFWLTMVMPTASDSGQTAIAFFAAIEADDMDAAYGMLSDEAKAKIPRDQFEASLPAHYRSQHGATVNGIGSGSGVVVGDDACVEGWLSVPSGMPGYFTVGLSEADDGTMRINTLVMKRRCLRQ